MNSFKNIFCHCALTLAMGGCALFQPGAVSSDPNRAKENICMNSEGRGRFSFEGQKHVFSFQSSFEEADLEWKIVIDFPMYGRESLELRWDAQGHQAFTEASYEEALLKNNRGLDPSLFEAAMAMWTQFFEDMLHSRGLISQDLNQQIEWSVEGKELRGQFPVKDKSAKITFLNPVSEGHFGKSDFELYAGEDRQLFGMELIVRNCLEKTD